MRTTVDLPQDLLDSARRVLGLTSNTDTVVVALREVVRRHRVEELSGLLGRVELDVDIEHSRRRQQSAERLEMGRLTSFAKAPEVKKPAPTIDLLLAQVERRHLRRVAHEKKAVHQRRMIQRARP